MLHYLRSCKIGADAAAVQVAGFKQMTISPAAADLIERNGGDVDPTFVGTIASDPRIMATSADVGALLTALGSDLFLAVDSTNKAIFYVEAVDEFGGRTAGATHKSYTINEGMLLPRTLTADQDQLATMEIEAIATHDGTNLPIVVATTVTLPAISVPTYYTLGPYKINSTLVDGLKGINIDFGWNAQSHRFSGAQYPTTVYAGTRETRITARGLNSNLLDTYGLTGADTTIDFFFRKAAQGGGLVADATAEHIKLTVYGRVQPDGPTGGQDGPLENSVSIIPRNDGTHDFMAWTVGAAIA